MNAFLGVGTELGQTLYKPIQQKKKDDVGFVPHSTPSCVSARFEPTIRASVPLSAKFVLYQLPWRWLLSKPYFSWPRCNYRRSSWFNSSLCGRLRHLCCWLSLLIKNRANLCGCWWTCQRPNSSLSESSRRRLFDILKAC